MLTESIARRYAKGLFEAAMAQKALDTVLHELSGFAKILKEEVAFREFWYCSVIPEETKKKSLKKSLPSFSTLTLNFLRVLIDKRREKLFQQAVNEYEQLFHDFYNQTHVQVIAAVKIPDNIQTALKEKLSQKLGKRVELDIHLDSSILGGMVLQMGDTILDGSLISKLNALHDKLLDSALPATT